MRDSLLWSHNNYIGPITAAIGYDSILSNSSSESSNPVCNTLWTLKIPTKIVCFIWLLINGRILTWEQLQSRGFHGPSCYILCLKNVEDIQHLFLSFPFTVSIVSYFAALYGFTMPCFDSLSSLLMHWFSTTVRYATFKFLPLFAY